MRDFSLGLRCALGALIVALALGGCSEGYQGERYLWLARKESAETLKHIEEASEAQIKEVVASFERVVEKAPGSTSAVDAYMIIASIYLRLERYDDARGVYELVIKNYGQNKRAVFEARAATAKTYEIEKHYDKAIEAYWDIYDRYPWSTVGMQAPLYVPELYKKAGNTEKVERSYERAIRSYHKQIPDAPNPLLANRVRSYLALAYQHQGKWAKAAEILEDMVGESLDVRNRPAALLSLATIYEHQLNDDGKARTYYTELLKEFPDHPFTKAAEAQLKTMGVSVEALKAQFAAESGETPQEKKADGTEAK